MSIKMTSRLPAFFVAGLLLFFVSAGGLLASNAVFRMGDAIEVRIGGVPAE